MGILKNMKMFPWFRIKFPWRLNNQHDINRLILSWYLSSNSGKYWRKSELPGRAAEWREAVFTVGHGQITLVLLYWGSFFLCQSWSPLFFHIPFFVVCSQTLSPCKVCSNTVDLSLTEQHVSAFLVETTSWSQAPDAPEHTKMVYKKRAALIGVRWYYCVGTGWCWRSFVVWKFYCEMLIFGRDSFKRTSWKLT